MPEVSSASASAFEAASLDEVDGLDDDGTLEVGAEPDGLGRAFGVTAVFAFRGGMAQESDNDRTWQHNTSVTCTCRRETRHRKVTPDVGRNKRGGVKTTGYTGTGGS